MEIGQFCDKELNEAPEQVLFGPWTPDERSNYEYLKAKLERLRGE